MAIKQLTFYIKNPLISDEFNKHCKANHINKSSLITDLVKNFLINNEIISKEDLEQKINGE